MKFAETVKKIVEKELSVYHGGSDPDHTRSFLLYFTPSEKYADWFKLNYDGQREKGIMVYAKVEDSNFLDLREYGGSQNIKPYYFVEIMKKNEIDIPESLKSVIEHIKYSKLYIFSFIQAHTSYAEDLWNCISAKYNGVILKEENLDNLEFTGIVDAYVVDTRHHKSVIHNVKKVTK